MLCYREKVASIKRSWELSVPCHLSNISITKALCDLGASINLMPLSIFRKLNIGEIKDTTISLPDRFLAYPHGIVKDVLVK